jgi:predicted ATP-grasp superfamily ATP-dependent carboligase
VGLIFLYEYTCAALAPQDVPPSLRAEGRAMFTAVAEDLARVPGVEVVGLVHEAFDETEVAGCRWIRTRAEEDACRALAATAAYTLLIAPEFADLLAARCRWVLEAGGRLLGPGPDAVRLTADKLALARHLHAHGVPTPVCHLADDPLALAALRFPVVCKPRHGAGSLATYLVNAPEDLAAALAASAAEMPADQAILQSFHLGLPVSIAFLIGPRQILPLLPASQQLSPDGRFRYAGGSLPLPPALAERAVALGRRAVEAVPGLRGYVGVDLVLGHAADGRDDQVIEINPRLTTSYIGLRALVETNLALALLRIAEGDASVRVAWRGGAVDFTADGRVAWQA